MASSFPLLRLPHLAFQHVVEQFGLAEKFFMSLCSKRTYRLVGNHRNKSDEFEIGVTFSKDDWCFHIARERNGQHEIIAFYVEKTFETRPSSLEKCISLKQKCDSRLEFYFKWNDRLDGLKVIIMYITELFKEPVNSLDLSHNDQSKDFQKLAEFVTSHQNTIEELSCNFYRVRDEDARSILRVCNPTKTLSLYYNPRRINTIDFSYLNAERITIQGFFKLTSDHLKSLNCMELDARGAKTPMEDINGFLKHWIIGGCSRLERFYSETYAFNLAVLFNEIEMVQRDISIERNVTFTSGEQKTIKGGFDITRNDGKVATILEINNPELTAFEMIVWA